MHSARCCRGFGRGIPPLEQQPKSVRHFSPNSVSHGYPGGVSNTDSAGQAPILTQTESKQNPSPGAISNGFGTWQMKLPALAEHPHRAQLTTSSSWLIKIQSVWSGKKLHKTIQQRSLEFRSHLATPGHVCRDNWEHVCLFKPQRGNNKNVHLKNVNSLLFP